MTQGNTRPSHSQANRWADDAGASCDCGHAKASHDDGGRCRAQRGRCKCRCFAVPSWGVDPFDGGDIPARADLMHPLGATVKLYDDRFDAYLRDKSFEVLSAIADDAVPGSFRAKMIRQARRDRHVVTELDALQPGQDVFAREVVEANDSWVAADGRRGGFVTVQLIRETDTAATPIVLRFVDIEKDAIAFDGEEIVIRRTDAFRAFVTALLAIAKHPVTRSILRSLEPEGVL
jgi:hypothetical protein